MLRNNATTPEKMLWERLKGRQLENRKFRRQHSIGHFILDFYCPEEKLCIELDGKHHSDQKNQIHDELRDDLLNDLGIKVLRFQNHEVLYSIESVLKFIKTQFNKSSFPSTPSCHEAKRSGYEGSGEARGLS